MMRPERICVTSQYSIEECFKDPKTVEALNERFTTHYLGQRDKYNEERQKPMAGLLDAVTAVSIPDVLNS